MAEEINIENIPNVTDFMAELQDSGKSPVYTPIYPDVYEGRQVIINSDRLIFNARLASDQGEKASYAAGGDIHVRGALDESLWLQDRQPYVMRDDGSGGHLTLILACVTTLH